MARVHRVGIAVRDIVLAIPIYSALFDTRFLRAGEAVTGASGLSVAASWGAGIELISPLPGRDELPARMVRKFLDERGEGIFALICEVENLEMADLRGEDAGLTVAQRIIFSDRQLQEELGGAFTEFSETVYDSVRNLGFSLVFNRMVLSK